LRKLAWSVGAILSVFLAHQLENNPHAASQRVNGGLSPAPGTGRVALCATDRMVVGKKENDDERLTKRFLFNHGAGHPLGMHAA
jgi:hypothetical protein